ncbi:zinc finger protein 449-like isoform X1 [Cotesia glomerata]|uniref:zinc finger protein 449-like isoform X1 n=1 Tax=Cotesia glomerata TaxID=32391 RepID=UPI001D011189|nr:zinc finger protein 449-like isoform X1 [Cotesia glomerata]
MITMNSSNIIHLGDSESEFSGSIAWMEAPDDISSGIQRMTLKLISSSIFGVQEYVDETFLVPKVRTRPSKKKKISKNLKDRNHLKNRLVDGITFEKAVSKRFNFKKPIINNDTWKKKILEFKRDKNIISENFNNPSVPKKSFPVILPEKVSVLEELNQEELSQQSSEHESTCNENPRPYNLLDAKFHALAEYLPVVLLERIQVPEKIVNTSTANVESVRKPNQNSVDKNSSSFKKSKPVTDKKEHKCEQCDYKCKRRSHLKHHILIHSSDLPFKCPKCSHKTKRLADLRKHVKIQHNNEFPHTCPHCSLGFTELIQLNNHNHRCFFAAENLFECEICKKRLATPNTLSTHKRSFHSAGSFTCSICQEKLGDKYSLELHRKTHKNGQTFTCNKCPFKTVHVANLKRHWSRRHKDENNLINK